MTDHLKGSSSMDENHEDAVTPVAKMLEAWSNAIRDGRDPQLEEKVAALGAQLENFNTPVMIFGFDGSGDVVMTTNVSDDWVEECLVRVASVVEEKTRLRIDKASIDEYLDTIPEDDLRP